MAKITTVGVALLLFVSVVTMAYGAELGLASAWLFEDGVGKVVTDALGGNDGEIQGGVEWSKDGKFGGAIQFPGQGDSYVRIPHNDVFNSEPYTFTVWTKLQPTTWQYVIWRNGEVWPEAENVRHIDIWIHQNHFPVFMWHVNGTVGRIDAQKIIADDEWHHIAKVYDGATVKMYIDGELEGEAESGGTLDTSESPIWLGARPGDVAATGLFDDVGFFTEALSEVNVNDVMTQGVERFAAVEPTGKLATTWGNLKEF